MSNRSPRPPTQPRPSKTTADSQRKTTLNKGAHKPSTEEHAVSKENFSNDNESQEGYTNSRILKNGDRTLLLCDDIDGTGDQSIYNNNNNNSDKNISIAIPDIFAIPVNTRDSFFSGGSIDLGFLSMSEDAMERGMMGLSPDSVSAPAAPTFPGNINPSSPEIVKSSDSTNLSSSNTNNNIKPTIPVAPSVQKGRRRMSRAEQFSALEKSLPTVKLDKTMRKSVVSAMVDMNIWNEEEDSDDDGEPGHKASARARKVIANAVQSKNNAAANAHGVRRRSLIKTTAEGNETQDADSQQQVHSHHSPTTTSTASTASIVREKVPLQRPSQLPVNEQAIQRDHRQQEERATVRDLLVNKAVQFLVDLNKKQEHEDQKQQEIQRQLQLQQQQHQNLSMTALANKPQKEIKAYTVKKFSISIVDRAIKRGKLAFKRAVDKHQAEEWRYLRRRTQAARFLSQVWRRHCIRTDVQKVLAMGRAAIHAKKVAEIEEQYQYRIRIAQRRVWEDNLQKEWLQEQREYPTFPVTKSIVEREIGPVKVNEEGLAMTTADEKLFAKDFDHTRPDLAPFSTKINSMISNSLKEVKHTLEKRQMLEKSLTLFAGKKERTTSFTRSRVSSTAIEDVSIGLSGDGDNQTVHRANSIVSSGTSSPYKIPTTPSAVTSRTPRAPKTPKTPGSAMQASARMFDFPATPVSLAFPISVGMPSTPLSQVSSRMRIDDVVDNMVQLSLPQRVLDRTTSSVRAASLVGWEEMARLDNMPTMEELKNNPKTKSSAYKVLEKLCGLSESDIMTSKLQRLREGKEEVSLANSKFLFI